jgi:putative heme-binding domain-containing protein
MQHPSNRFLVLSLALLVHFAGAVTGDSQAAEPAPRNERPLREYREHAMRNEGVPERGRAVFNDQRTLCFQCHSTDGKGGKTGPDLYAAGDKFSRSDLIRSVLEPSATIMMGYSTTLLETLKGERIEGVLKSVSDTELVLAGLGSVTQRVARAAIREQRTSAVSLMPTGLQAALSLEEFTDLIAYLESLKQPEMQVANAARTPVAIQRLSRPVMLHPFHSAAHRFDHPVSFDEHPVLDGMFVVAEQTNATLWLLEKRSQGDVKTLFADVRKEVFVTETEGLLGVAFHPRFRENRKYYLMHEFMEKNQRSMIIAERMAREDFRSDAGGPSRRVLKIDVSTEVHHGGGILFGPDGYLYIGMGDAGPQEDPQGHGQDLRSFAGKLLRIDVDRTDSDRGYSIPASNPFANHPDPEVRREIFAYGLRQPWRFSFDPATGDLWVADVGQDRFEEVGIVRAGENHGWNVFEGFELFSTVYRKERENYVPPLISFRRRHGASVTAGYVYRARPESSFHGVYICGDYESKRLWGITQQNRGLQSIREIGTSPAKVVAFGRDRQGELYAIGYDLGMIYKLDFEQAKFE